MDACQFSRFRCAYCTGHFRSIMDHIRYESKNTHRKHVNKNCSLFSTDLFELVRHETEYDIVLRTFCSKYIQNKNLGLHIQKGCTETHCRNIIYGCIDKVKLSQHESKCTPEKFADVCKYCCLSTDKINEYIQRDCCITRCRNAIKGCKFFSLDTKELMTHEAKCNGVVCPHCSSYVQNQEDHTESGCNGIQRKNAAYGCEFCSIDKTKLLEHKKMCTPDKVMFKCEFCEVHHSSKIALKRHHLRYTSNACQRDDCGKRYSTLNAFITHIEQRN